MKLKMMMVRGYYNPLAGVTTYLVAALVMVLCVQTPAHSQSAKALAASPQAASATDVTGVWIDHTGRGAVEIVPCGTRVCGYVYWVKDLVNKQGQPIVDANNPDPRLKNKPICGTQILSNLARGQANAIGHVWSDGSIYNPDDGGKFDAEIKLTSANELSVLGYLGLKFMGETFSWKRAPADLVRCGPPRT